MTSSYVAPNISSLSDMRPNMLSSSSSLNNTDGTGKKSFFDIIREKSRTILYIIVIIIVANIMVYVLRHFTTTIDNTYVDKVAQWVPWLKKTLSSSSS